MKKFLALVLAMLMILSLVACGGGGTSSTPADPTPSNPTPSNPTPSNPTPGNPPVAEVKYKEKVIIGNSGIVARVDPAAHNSETNGHAHVLTHNTLVGVEYDKGNNIIPELAKSWTVSDDGKTYTFKLEEGVKFHNDTTFDADDVIYTLEHCKASSFQANKLACIIDMKAPDPYTVVLTLDNPNSDLLFNLGTAYMSIICKEALDADPEKGFMVGTGPYVFSEWVYGDHATMTRNEEYWGELPRTKIIEFRVYPEASARVIALQNGEIDVCLNTPAADADHIVDDEDLILINNPSTILDYLGLNTKSPNSVMANQKVRQAINYAINREELALVMGDGYAVAPDSIIPSSIWGYTGVPTYEYNVEKAKQLLAEAGYPDGVTVGLVGLASTYPSLYEVLSAQLAKANITLELTTEDSTVRSDYTKNKNFDMLAIAWVFASFNNDLRAMFYSNSSSNRTMITDPYVDGVLDQGLIESDMDKNLQSYKELTQYLTDQALIVPMYLRAQLIGVNKNLEGAIFYDNFRYDFTNVAVVEK